jgi:hypothetical protein
MDDEETNTELTILMVDGIDLLEDLGKVITLPYGTDSVHVDVITKSEHAEYVVHGYNTLVTGENLLTIRVTASDGINTHKFIVKLLVESLVEEEKEKEEVSSTWETFRNCVSSIFPFRSK